MQQGREAGGKSAAKPRNAVGSLDKIVAVKCSPGGVTERTRPVGLVVGDRTTVKKAVVV